MTSLAPSGPPRYTTDQPPPPPQQHHTLVPLLHHPHYSTEMLPSAGGQFGDDSLPRDQFTSIISTMPQFIEDEPYPENSLERKEREIIHTNRVKLTDYIHDATVLFPHMKQHGIFSVFDCDVIKGETVAHNRVDKFIDVLLTKGPKAIGVFHESLGKTYPGVFDYLTRLFASTGIDLPETRRMRPASIIDQVSDDYPRDDATSKDSQGGGPGDEESGSATAGKSWGQNVSRRGMTVRRSLDVLSRQLDAIQTERNELKNALSSKEKEISDLIRSKEKNRDDLLSITQHYQEIYKNLVNWKESLTSENSQRLQELLAERECIQAEYDALENDYALVQLELRAARERISRLMNHLERSEQLVAFTQEERDVLQNKVGQLEGELQRLERKKQRDMGGASKGLTAGRRDTEVDQLAKQLEKAQKELEASRAESVELSERLTVARRERNEALEEKDEILRKQYLEEQKRKKLENELRGMYKKLQQIKDSSESHSSDGSYSMHPGYPEGTVEVKMEDFTTVIQASEDMGMKLGLGILVVHVDENGLATRCGIKPGDQLCQINHITVTSDRDPLDLCNRLLHNASTLVTLLIRRPVVSYETSTGTGVGGNSRTMTSNSVQTLSMIHQTPSTNDARKASTIGRFALPLNNWDAGNSFVPDYLGCFQPTPASSKQMVGSLPNPTPMKSASPTLASLPGRADMVTHGFNMLNKRRKMKNNKRKNSEDAQSCHTSSSDDDQMEISFPPDLSSSFDNSNTGIVHSPDNLRKGKFDYRCSNTDDEDLPPSISRPSTFITDGSDDYELGGMATLNVKDPLDDIDKESNSSSNISPSRPPYLQLSSTPADITVSKKKAESPRLKRAEARRWMAKHRRSQSLVDMNDVANAIVVDTTDLNTRRVIIPWGRLGDGISLVGGRGRGIFIYSVKEDSRGLQTGDEVLKIGGESAKHMTYSDAVKTIEFYASKGDQCMITVQSNLEGFKKLSSLQDRDSFYVKTLYSHKKALAPKELTFDEGEVMRVIDTMPPMPNMWKVKRIDAYGKETEEGYISIESTMENWSQKVQAGTTATFPIISRFSQNRRLNSTPGPEGFQSLRKPGTSEEPYDMFQPVRMLRVNSPRPVIIMGVCENEVRQALLEDSAFSLPPIKSHTSLTMLKDNEGATDHILLKRTGENVRYCIVSDIKSIADQDQHCVLMVEPTQLKNNRALSSINPITLLLFTKKSSTITFKFQVYKCSSETVSKYLQDLKQIEDEYSSCFTGKIEISGGLDNIVKQVKSEIACQQNMVIWEEED
ncbi:PREDICTED: uncharacterized protein LOC105314219 isoform X1 [Amphimedon queenslandica]|uniref:PDZ domain-containing protein n=2 Tax=Amphimedon queenslandica TaxID=400682 RepID=A0AAN0JJK3_AMPQE|nr:PREDICTED: uncharacterized protein LOC105314219 isoform X1 [Amphimedon queenslandica]|eukprot:XP_019857159.1 PREDICTED: uncharacterized protein LOC105314219 isoform X1 [Amphimedon queenslandica]